MNEEFKLPKGARWLRVGEIIKDGDIAMDSRINYKKPSVLVGQRFEEMMLPVYRVEKKSKPRKPHRFDGMTLGEVARLLHYEIPWWQKYAEDFAREVRRRDRMKRK